MAMSDGGEVGWVKVKVSGMVSPRMTQQLVGGTNGVVAESGSVMISGGKLEPVGDGLEPGMDVRVRSRRGGVYARPLHELKKKKRNAKERRKVKRKARQRYKDWKRRRAGEFWNSYDIPFEWDVAVKGRRSGLTRGSAGNGRDSNTVEHLYVLEGFDEGRLSRAPDRYLCEDSAKFRFTEGERRQDSEGGSYIPPVTCQRCLDFMDRWKRGGGDE